MHCYSLIMYRFEFNVRSIKSGRLFLAILKATMFLGYGGRVSKDSPSWKRHRHPVSKSAGDLGEGGEDPPAHHYDFR